MAFQDTIGTIEECIGTSDVIKFLLTVQVKVAFQGKSGIMKEVVGASSYFGGRVPVARKDALPLVAELMAPFTGCNKSDAQVSSPLCPGASGLTLSPCRQPTNSSFNNLTGARKTHSS